MKQVGGSDGLSDREWRQMRRTLSKLEFEPVPETPQLLPRPLFIESTEDERGDQAALRADDLDDDCDRPPSRQQEFAPMEFDTACVMIAGCDAKNLF
ncbi:hypothetical protein PybrP1_005191 [[Pythium] brassicae (nom. inval.)]|nr:hypothetical protein PybrP1_005191 [[Pythium] brassicae (nom. inval.)]